MLNDADRGPLQRAAGVVLEPEQMEALVVKFIESGKPESWGFARPATRSACGTNPLPRRYVAFPEFDAQVLGGHYTNHPQRVQLKPTIRIAQAAADPPNPDRPAERASSLRWVC